MKFPFMLVWLMAFFLVPILAPSQSLALGESNDIKKPGNESEIPKEPGWRHPSYRGWESMSVPGLVATYYDLDLDRQLDYMVIRKVIRKASAEETTIEKAIEIAKFDGLSVFFSHPVVYFTNRNPLFYCLGVDYRRNCRDIWIDIAEDGLNGNEEQYTLSTPSIGVR